MDLAGLSLRKGTWILERATHFASSLREDSRRVSGGRFAGWSRRSLPFLGETILLATAVPASRGISAGIEDQGAALSSYLSL